MRSWKMIPALLALLLTLHGCNLGNGPDGGGTEAEGLSGIVVDPSGNGVANARVLVFADPGSGLAKGLAKGLSTLAAVTDSTRTDAAGRYEFDSLPEGDYALLARTVRNDSTLTVLVRGIAYEGGERDLGTAMLKAGGKVSVSVRSTSGAPVAGAACVLAGVPGLEATSDAGGKCLLTGLPEGVFEIRVTHPLGSGSGGAVRVRAGRTVNAGAVVLDPAPGPIDTTEVPGDTVLPGAQEVTLDVEADTYVNRSVDGTGAHVNNNFGAADGLLVGVYDLNTIPTTLLRFTLPSNLRSARITKAMLILTSNGWTTKNVRPDTVLIKAHALLRDWKEGSGQGTPNSPTVDGVTARERFYGTQDGTEDWSITSIGFNDLDATSGTIGSDRRARTYTGAWMFDITFQAKNWADDPSRNFGLLLRVDVPATNDLVQDYPAFYSRESAVPATMKPRLVLTLSP